MITDFYFGCSKISQTCGIKFYSTNRHFRSKISLINPFKTNLEEKSFLIKSFEKLSNNYIIYRTFIFASRKLFHALIYLTKFYWFILL